MEWTGGSASFTAKPASDKLSHAQSGSGMKAVGRFEILNPVVSGTVETFTAKDPSSGATVLLHLLPADAADTPEKVFLEFAPGCPGKILDTGFDSDSKRAFVVTEYPKDRKSLLLWIKSLSALPPKPAAKPAPPPSSTKSSSDGATRMFDPAAMFGGMPPADVPQPPPPPTGDGATRMFDPSAIFGGAPAASADAGSTKMFDPSAVFGGAPSSPSTAGAATPSPAAARNTPPPASSTHRPITDPFANLKSALERAAGSAPSQSGPAKSSGGEFTRRFELPKQFRNAPTRVDRTSAPASHPKQPKGEEGDKGAFTLMMEAYGERVDQVEGPAQSPATTPNSDGATRMFDPSALFGGAGTGATSGPNTDPATPEPPVASDYPPTVRLPAMPDDGDKTSR